MAWAFCGGVTLGSRNVNAATTSHITASLYPARTEASAFSALITQQPHIQPNVAPARTGPNSAWVLRNREKTIAVVMLPVGVEKNAWSWINKSTSQKFQPSWMAEVAMVIVTAEATASQRRTLTGETWRSAIAPKIKGEMKAATAVVAKAYGISRCSP